MILKILILLLPVYFMPFHSAIGQAAKVQQGLLINSATSVRLGNVQVINKRSNIQAWSNTVGVFNIIALPGDTLQFSSTGYLTCDFIVTDFADKIIYLKPVIQLAEVVIKENALVKEIRETQNGYRKKSVFYTGTPHYYYLVLKPMTFIYENFKSEVKDARRFNRFANRELNSYEINKRFNDSLIMQVVTLTKNEYDDFRADYTPSLQQLNSMNDYELINYIKSSYQDYKRKTMLLKN